MHIFNKPNYDFLRWRWHAIALSWVIIISGILAIAKNGIPKGVEFAGGTVVIDKFDQAVSVQQVREALDRNYPAGVNHHDPICLAHGRQPVRDDNGRSVSGQSDKGLLDSLLRLGVKRTGCLVEQQHGRIA